MNSTKSIVDDLKQKIEDRMGRKLCVHGDFVELSEMIFQRDKTHISPTTLKRLWGYLKQESPAPQIRTLNVLSVFVGYRSYDDFCCYQENQNDYSSEFVRRQSLHCFLMQPGMQIRVKWYPNRSIVLKHEGDGDLFTVISSLHSKLEPGMTLHCEMFTKKEPLYLKNVKGPFITEPCDYICGKIEGIDYEVI